MLRHVDQATAIQRFYPRARPMRIRCSYGHRLAQAAAPYVGRVDGRDTARHSPGATSGESSFAAAAALRRTTFREPAVVLENGRGPGDRQERDHDERKRRLNPSRHFYRHDRRDHE